MLCARIVTRVLSLTKSPYYDAFSLLIKEVDLAANEALDNSKYLSTLRPVLERLQTSEDFLDLPGIFSPIMHLTLLVWRDSKHYNSPAALAVLLRQVRRAHQAGSRTPAVRACARPVRVVRGPRVEQQPLAH